MGDVLFICGPKVSLSTLEQKLKQTGLNYKFINMDHSTDPKTYGKAIFITSFQSLLPIQEMEYLKTHNNIDEILMINPDFDVLSDLINNFSKRLPKLKYTVYDERIHKEHGSDIYDAKYIEYLKLSEDNLIKRLVKTTNYHHTNFFLTRWWNKYLLNRLYKKRPKLINE